MGSFGEFFMSVPRKFVNSSKELSHPVGVTISAMCLALYVVLGCFANLTLPFFGDILKVSFTFVAIAIASMIYGPVAGAIVGGMGDILSFLLVPTGAYFPGFTINGILFGIVYGLFLYKNNCTILRVVISKLIVMIFIELLLSSLWLSMLYGNGYIAILSTRIVGKLVMFIPECFIIYALGMVTKRIPYISAKKA